MHALIDPKNAQTISSAVGSITTLEPILQDYKRKLSRRITNEKSSCLLLLFRYYFLATPE